MLSIITKTVDAFVIITTIPISVKLTKTGFGLVFIPFSTGIACRLILNDKVFIRIILELIQQKHRIRLENLKKTKVSFDKLYGKRLQDFVIDKKENDSLNNNWNNMCNWNQKGFFIGIKVIDTKVLVTIKWKHM